LETNPKPNTLTYQSREESTLLTIKAGMGGQTEAPVTTSIFSALKTTTASEHS